MIDGVLCRAQDERPLFAARRTDRWWERLRGLLGTLEPPAHGLYITPCGSVHTMGMRYPIDLVFLAKDGRVLRVAEAVPPWRVVGARGAHAVAKFAAGTVRAARVVAGERLTWRAGA